MVLTVDPGPAWEWVHLPTPTVWRSCRRGLGNHPPPPAARRPSFSAPASLSAGPAIFPEKRSASFSDRKFWNLGRSNGKLSYYDGMIQLTYRDGTPYNDEKRTPRATLITFLCDRDAGVGFPEYQVGATGAHVRLLGDRAKEEAVVSLVKAGEEKKVGEDGARDFSGAREVLM